MRFGFWPNPMASWTDLLEICCHAEAGGWDGLWYADHFMPAGRDNSGPTHESWTFVSALAASVPRVRIGHLVNGNTYRHPAVLAKMATGADHVSGGRFVLGLGAGWQENEHRAYGIPFFTLRERLERLEEACQIVNGLLRNERTTFEGQYYQLDDAPCNPKPLGSPLPLMVGGGGEKVTMRIAAQYADEWNVWGTPEVMEHKLRVLDAHCTDLGRDPRAVQRSAAAAVDFGDEDQPRLPLPAVIGGDVDALRRSVARYAELGLDELIVPDFNLGLRVADRKRLMDRFMNEVVHKVG